MSEWRERANLRRDQRQTKLPVIRAPAGSKKDTKRWCRGKVGAEHKPVCMAYNDRKNVCCHSTEWKVLVCSQCEKVLDHWHPSPFSRRGQTPPAWATPPTAGFNI